MIISGQMMLAKIIKAPPTIVHTAAVGVNRRQNTPSSKVTTSGGVTAAVNAPCAE